MFNFKTLTAIFVAVTVLFNDGYTKSLPKKRTTRDADISRAIEILQEQKDRLKEEDFRRLVDSGLDLEALGLLTDNEDNNPEDDSLWLSETMPDEGQDKEGVIDEEMPFIEAAEDVGPNNDVVETSKEELDNIFDNAEPVVQITKTEKVVKEETPVNDEDDFNSSEPTEEELTDDEYRALLRAVEKLQKHSDGGVIKKDIDTLKKKRTPKDIVSVSKEELNSVFGDAAKGSAPDVLKRSPYRAENIEETLPAEDYMLLNKYLNYDESRKKRFSQPDTSANEVYQTLVDDRKQLLDEIKRLKLVNHLEDMENEALTNALNQATQSQQEGSVSPKEFESVEKAIKLEEALQNLNPSEEQLAYIVQQIAMEALKQVEPDYKAQQQMDLAELEDEYPVEEVKKRGGYQDSQGTWYDIDDQDNDVDNLPSRKILELLDNQIAENDKNDDDDDVVIPTDQTDLVQYIPDNNEDECKEVDSYSDGCAFADYYGLPIDTEARELCNRYQICYTCGASFGLNSEWCDNAYRQVYGMLCRENSECVIEAELFLRTMKLKRRFIKQQICTDQCTAEYIGIV